VAGRCENVKTLGIHKVRGICRPAEENTNVKERVLHQRVSLVT